MISLSNGSFRKILVACISVLVLGTIYLTALVPLLSYYKSTAVRLHDRQELAKRYQNLVRDLPRLRGVAAEHLTPAHDASLLLTGPTEAVAAATMQSALKEMVEREGAKLSSAEMLPLDDGSEIIHPVGVRVAFSGNLKLLTSVIKEIETTRPVLSIGDLEIHSAGAFKAEENNDVLAVAMNVYGYLPH
jgi:hypothetical protein